eukprot:6204581-Pleurochrysis_carterae.AAC.1
MASIKEEYISGLCKIVAELECDTEEPETSSRPYVRPTIKSVKAASARSRALPSLADMVRARDFGERTEGEWRLGDELQVGQLHKRTLPLWFRFSPTT